MNPKWLGEGRRFELAAVRWAFHGLDVIDACFIFGAFRAAPVFPAVGTACRYRPQQVVVLLRAKNSQNPHATLDVAAKWRVSSTSSER